METERTRSGGSNPNPALGFLLFNWIRQSWDELGPLMLGSLFLFVLALFGLLPSAAYMSILTVREPPFLPYGVIFLLFCFLGLWLVVCAWFSVNRYVEQILTFQYPSWTTLFTSFPRYILTSLWTLLFFGTVLTVLLFNLTTYPRMFSGSPLLEVTAVSLTGWIILFVALVQVHAIPFLVHQDRPFLTAVRRAALVTVWKPFRSAFIFLIEILFFPFSFLPPLCFVLPGVFAVLSNLSLLILLEEWRDPYEKTPEAIRAGA